MLKGFRIAVVEDDEFMGSSLTQRLELEGADVVWLRQITRALGALRTPPRPIDAVICDIKLPDGTGEELYTRLCETASPPPFLFVTGHGGIEQAVRLMRAGAADYVTKPFDISVLLERLANLLAGGAQDAEFPVLLGVSPAARRVEDLITEAASMDRPVLILGGPGTGKSLVARRIHERSDRRAAPFVAVNIAREPNAAAALFEAEGALAETAEGTLYLHAIERLDDGAVLRLMASLESADFAGRFIAGSGAELVAERDGERSTAELFYRLDAFEIPIPPLAERPEDAVWLMERMFPAMNARRDRPLDRISSLAEEAVRSHSWPGGGRELRARLSQGVAAAAGPALQPADIFPERIAEGALPGSLAEARRAAERKHIIEVLDRSGGQISEAARLLKISRTTLWEKMQKLKIDRDQP